MQLVVRGGSYRLQVMERDGVYLNRRFSKTGAKGTRVTLVDPRNLVVYTGTRIAKLSTEVESYVTGDPYALPDTLLNRQLSMRQYYPPHHPSIIKIMLENGWFD